MSVSKIPHLSHGVHTIDFLNLTNKPVVLSVLNPCPSSIRVFSAISTTAIGGAKCHGTRYSVGGRGDNGLRKESGLGFDKRGEKKVRCEVDVISWRERGIRGEIWVNSDSQSVWNVLTKYERLADFIPNLVCSNFVLEKDLIVREEACRIGRLFGGFTSSYHALFGEVDSIHKRTILQFLELSLAKQE